MSKDHWQRLTDPPRVPWTRLDVVNKLFATPVTLMKLEKRLIYDTGLITMLVHQGTAYLVECWAA